ncbi:MAG: amino acid permease [Symploca sp. SIO2C1]|nr:amino acid permease [Symploca sp. SIO2C1]
MSVQKTNGIVSYENVHESYLRQRQLKGSANWFLLWGLGVGAVISGDFYGWNYGLIVGGFWGMAIATILMAIMYLCMVYSTAELTATFPHAGGFYSFTRNALGPFWGYIAGITVSIEYVLANAAVVFALSQYLKDVIPGVPVYLIWLFAYATFLTMNIWSLELSLNVCLWITLVAIMVLGIFYISMLVSGVFQPELLFNLPPEPGQSAYWLPKGWTGVFAAIPFAIWLYLAIEQLPMTAEETGEVPKNMPTGMILGMFTLIILSVFTLVLNSGVGGGAAAIGETGVPLGDGLEAYFGEGATSTLVTTLALICGLIASLHGNMFAYGRIIFSLSRAGYIPRWFSVTSKNHTPYRALILGAAIGFICVMLISASSNAAGEKQFFSVDAIILNMAVFGALISYLLVMLSYLKLKVSRPDLPRPYTSPLGIWGAVIGGGLAIFALVACLSVPDYQPGILGILIVLVVALLYFFLYSRNRLVAQAPEEMAALRMKIQSQRRN